MNSKRRNLILVFIILNLICLPWIICHNNYDLEKILKYSRELALFEFGAISLLLAISLFDQFGLNKKLTEKKIELIIELLTEFKKQRGFGTNYEVKEEIWSNPAFYFEKNMAEKAVQYYTKLDSPMKGILNSKFTMDLNDFDDGFEKIKKVLNNPLMPPSILDKAQFLKSNGGVGGKQVKESKEMTYLYFTDTGKKKLINKEIDHWVFAYNNNGTLYEFLKKFDNLFKACEDWINKHSNISEDLNLEGF